LTQCPEYNTIPLMNLLIACLRSQGEAGEGYSWPVASTFADGFRDGNVVVFYLCSLRSLTALHCTGIIQRQVGKSKCPLLGSFGKDDVVRIGTRKGINLSSTQLQGCIGQFATLSSDAAV